ncbi:MAG: AAA family ATPase [Clostridia bacterium]|nr:AAA family ATPase [Clostridia bacterium]
MNRQLELLIKAKANVIEVVSYEDKRIQGFVNQVAKSLKMTWYVWNEVNGLLRFDSRTKKFEKEEDIADYLDILNFFTNNLEDNAILVLQDFHHILRREDPRIIRKIREILQDKSINNKVIILSMPIKCVPDDLSKELSVVEVGLPNVQVLNTIAKNCLNDYDIDQYEIEDCVLEAALGLTIMEAELAFSKAIIEFGRLDKEGIPFIIKEKESIIKKTGLLEYYHSSTQLNNVGGLENLKDWISKRERSFTQEAKKFGVDTPKGIMLLGVPGCGKSLTAKAVAKSWNYPLLRFDIGKVFGGIVGESEHNVRRALDIAKAIAPCVLWIDEIEKGLSGVQSSGQTDGGTTSRVFGTLLTWMQEKTEPVFVIATANNIKELPPELMRKGRFDEVFFVDLPSIDERKKIFQIHIENRKRDIVNFDLDTLAKESKGFSGSEIEECVKEGLHSAFSNGKELTTEYIMSAIKATIPLSITMGDGLRKLREWAKFRARMASSGTVEEIDVEKGKIIPKLKSEVNNPFID